MTESHRLLLLPGDGIGPEVMTEVRRVIDWMGTRLDVGFALGDGLIGGAAIDAEGTPISDETVARAKESDAVLLGAVGGPQWDALGFDIRPERGLLRIRKDLNLFANLRPAVVFDALAHASSLKADVVRGLDMVIVRELTGGIYFGEPRSIEELGDGTRRGVNTQVYTTPEIQRVARVAFELARTRARRVCLGRQGERPRVQRAVARRGAEPPRRGLRRHRAEPHVRRQLRHAVDPQSQAVRRHPYRQLVRRHPLGRGLHADRLARHVAVGVSRRRR